MELLLQLCSQHPGYVLVATLVLIASVYFYHKHKFNALVKKLKSEYASQLSSSLSGVKYQKAEVEQSQLDADRETARLIQEADRLTEREHQINNQVRERTIQTILDISTRSYIAETPTFSAIRSPSAADDIRPRLFSSLTQSLKITAPFNITSRIIGSSGDAYETSLVACTCKDFQVHHHPCKHMYRLACEVGALIGFDNSALMSETSVLLTDCDNAKKELARLTARRGVIDRMIATKVQSYPWLAKLYADYIDVLDGKLEESLRQKAHPAVSAADKVSAIRREKSLLAQQRKAAEYQLHFYESLFPWLLDFKEIPPISAYESATATSSTSDPEETYATYRQWLSPTEYQSLADAEKFQLALDRYQHREKSNWEIGIQYERYIGYLCEKAGYSVLYHGATQKLEDMGRDLLLSRENVVVAVQCKRWAAAKTIHENHVFQLCGTTFELQAHYPDKTVIAAFVTSTVFSEVATMCAERLDVRLFSSIPYCDYPMIKCNISKSGEKIYHLPFDQQYDRISISEKSGCFYCATTADAENAGFRRAYRWRGNHNS